MSIAHDLKLNPTTNAFDKESTFDRRRSARVDLNRKALIRIDSALTFPARVRDLSFDSAQVICAPKYALLVDPSGNGDSLNERRPLELAIGLASSDDYGLANVGDGTENENMFKTRCRVKYCARVSAHNDQVFESASAADSLSGAAPMIMGLKFLNVDFAMLQKLDRFLDSFRPI